MFLIPGIRVLISKLTNACVARLHYNRTNQANRYVDSFLVAFVRAAWRLLHRCRLQQCASPTTLRSKQAADGT